MKIQLKDVEKPLSEKDILEFETHFKIKLPINYKKFLLKNNGGLSVDSDNFETLYSIKYGSITIESVIRKFQESEEIIPKELIPIADSWSGNIYCVSIKEEDYGKIYCCYLDEGGEIKFKANSLEEFLGGKI